MAIRYHSNGKLLISAEYAVLDGALALAVPTNYGQSLIITPNNSGQLHWKSKDLKKQIWFDAVFDPYKLNYSNTSSKTAKKLQEILLAAQQLNPNFLNTNSGYTITTELDFPIDWGLGSSSTLINNIADWANVDAYELLKMTFGGSGYDIACAKHNNAVLYRLDNAVPLVEEITFSPPFKRQLYFIYLNKKKDSREGIAHYRDLGLDKTRLIEQISAITKQMSVCGELGRFESLMNEHELLLSEVPWDPHS